jgi:hypothetical protein
VCPTERLRIARTPPREAPVDDFQSCREFLCPTNPSEFDRFWTASMKAY